MPDLDRILLAFDGSKDSLCAAGHAANLAEAAGSAVMVFHVNPTELTAEVIGEVQAHRRGIETSTEAETMVLSVVETMRARGIECEPQLGSAAGDLLTTSQLIVAAADRFRADLVVAGSRGLPPARRLLMGSVSHALLQHAHCPVLVIRCGSELRPPRRLGVG